MNLRNSKNIGKSQNFPLLGIKFAIRNHGSKKRAWNILKKWNGVKDKSMIAYEFYWHDENGEAHLLGILPERRKGPQRITEESIMKWGNLILGNQADIGSIYFVWVEV
jgi:hypothetical protein